MDIQAIGKRAAGSAELFIKTHGPAMLTAAGVGGFIATTYLTGRAVLKSQKKIDTFRQRHDEIVNRTLDAEYKRKDQAQELSKLWTVEGFDIAKDFVPAISVGSVSIFCIIMAHVVSRNQQASLAAAYAALHSSFGAYRKRVQEEIGEEKERELYGRAKLIERTNEEGEPLPCEIDYDDVRSSPYSRWFDEYNVNWTKTPEYNRHFIQIVQNQLNDRLQAYGFLFLNEAYEALGMERDQRGQLVGWKTKARGGKDGFVDFGIYDIFDDSSRAFVNGLEGTVLVDFNVDGPIAIPDGPKRRRYSHR